LSEGFARPCQSPTRLIRRPRLAAESGIPDRAVIRPTRMLRRGMEADVRNISTRNRNGERLNSAVQVLIVDSVFIVPEVRPELRYLIGNAGNAVGPRCGLKVNNCRAGPSHYSGLRANGRSYRREAERAGGAVH